MSTDNAQPKRKMALVQFYNSVNTMKAIEAEKKNGGVYPREIVLEAICTTLQACTEEQGKRLMLFLNQATAGTLQALS